MFSPKAAKDHKSADVANQAAIKIQSLYRGYLSRKKTNIQGKSQGKEIEIYLPLGIKKRNTDLYSYEMIGRAKTVLCQSALFNIQIDCMYFKSDTYSGHKVSIAEIVTTPYRQPNEEKTNLRNEAEIDAAVSDFLNILEDFTLASAKKNQKSFLSLEAVLITYNKKHIKHPLVMARWLKEYLNKPERRMGFCGKLVPVEKHENSQICFIYASDFVPNFYFDSGPKTEAAAIVVSQNQYRNGKLLVHVQKTFSMSLEDYKPDICLKDFNHTPTQIKFLQEARHRAETFITKYPLPQGANTGKILGLLTVCVEHILSITKVKEYKGCYEKADRTVFSLRHILHYVKINICNEAEIKWFSDMFKSHLPDIQKILCVDHYAPDYRGNEGAYSCVGGMALMKRYDVIFDLFGDFYNQKQLSLGDKENAYLMFIANHYGIKSWKDLFNHHVSLSDRTHLCLQKVMNQDGRFEYHALFEARRLQLMTVHDFVSGKSQVVPPLIVDNKHKTMECKSEESGNVPSKLHFGPRNI